MNNGKMFEQDFRKSVPEGVKYIRLKDDTSGFAGINNPCDCIIFSKPTMYMLELKSHLGKSVPFSCISRGQIEGMNEASTYEGLVAGVVFNFRDVDKTYFVAGDLVHEFYVKANRRSYPIDWCRENGTEIEGKRKITRFKYDIEKFIGESRG